MTVALIRKLLRDLRWPLLGVAIFLAGFECLWVKITQRITGQIVPLLLALSKASGVSADRLESTLFEGPGRLLRTIMGGETIGLDRAMDMLSIGYVHPTVQVAICIWAIGRSAGAIAGEIDRGTMELLMAQPVYRYRLVSSYLILEFLTIPLLCLAMWSGTFLGNKLVGPISVSSAELNELPIPVEINEDRLKIDPWDFGPSLLNVGALFFAISGYTIWLSSRGRSRWKVLGIAIFLTLLQFIINVIGQLWDAIAVLRPLTVFFYYQPQQIALNERWFVDVSAPLNVVAAVREASAGQNLATIWSSAQVGYPLNVVVVLLCVGAIGYALAFWTFCRRDLPAPL
jgi:ABC-2 type transport system permease protein